MNSFSDPTRIDPPHQGSQGSAVSVALLMANRIDADALSALLSSGGRFHRVDAVVSEKAAFAVCERSFPHVLVVDPKACENLIQCVTGLTRNRYVRHVIVLDDQPRDARIANLLPLPNISYMTRVSGYSVLERAILQIASGAGRVFGPSVAERIHRTSKGWRLEPAHDRSIAQLTTRELEVMQLLARGHSVRDCAKHLELAPSTVDNHKSRLMKKLQIHKAAELTHVAIRDGLINA